MEKIVSTKNNKAVTNTQIIATRFGRSHNELIHALRYLKQDCGAAFSKKNFFGHEHNSLHWVTCAGFLVLSGLFTGARDARIKITFIDAFAKAQEEIHNRRQQNVPQTMNEALQSAHPTWGKIANYNNACIPGNEVVHSSITARQ